MKKPVLVLAAALALVGTCAARDRFVTAQQLSGTSVVFVLDGAYSNATLTIAGPNDTHARTYSKGGAVAIDISKLGGLPDGLYNYQLTAAGRTTVSVSEGLADGRSRDHRLAARTPVALSGTFRVKGAKIVDSGAVKPEGRRDQDTR